MNALPNISGQLEHTRKIRDYFLSLIKDNPRIHINSPKDALANIVNMSVTGIPSQVLINYLSERGIYVSAGSACKKGHRSEVLSSLGVAPNLIDSAIRVSFSRYTTVQEIEIFAGALNDALNSIRTKL